MHRSTRRTVAVAIGTTILAAPSAASAADITVTKYPWAGSWKYENYITVNSKRIRCYGEVTLLSPSSGTVYYGGNGFCDAGGYANNKVYIKTTRDGNVIRNVSPTQKLTGSYWGASDISYATNSPGTYQTAVLITRDNGQWLAGTTSPTVAFK